MRPPLSRILKPWARLCTTPSYLRMNLGPTLPQCCLTCTSVSFQGFGSGCAPEREWNWFFHLLMCVCFTSTHTPMPTYALSVKFRGITAVGDRVKLRDQCRVFKWPLLPWWMRGAPDRHGIPLMRVWEFPAWPSANNAPGIRWPGRWTSVLWCPSHTGSRQKQNVWA